MAECGTQAGAIGHRRHGERPCPRCLRSETERRTIWRVQSGRGRLARVPYVLLGELLATAPPEVVAWAEEELPPGVVTAARIAAARADASEGEASRG